MSRVETFAILCWSVASYVSSLSVATKFPSRVRSNPTPTQRPFKFLPWPEMMGHPKREFSQRCQIVINNYIGRDWEIIIAGVIQLECVCVCGGGGGEETEEEEEEEEGLERAAVAGDGNKLAPFRSPNSLVTIESKREAAEEGGEALRSHAQIRQVCFL